MVGLGLACGKMIPRILVSLVFIVAGGLKLHDPLAFADGIAAFRVFPNWSINVHALLFFMRPRWCGVSMSPARVSESGHFCKPPPGLGSFGRWCFSGSRSV